MKHFQFRENSSTLSESMSTVIEFSSFDELYRHLLDKLLPYGVHFERDDLKIEHYCFDERVNWNTYIVTLKHYGVIGFTNALPT